MALIALEVLFNFRSVGYLVPIIPSFCLILAVVFHRVLEYRSPARIVAAVLLMLMLMAGLTQAQIQFGLRQRNAWLKIMNGKMTVRVPEKNIADGKRVAEELGLYSEKVQRSSPSSLYNPRAIYVTILFFSFTGTYDFRSQN
jgi:hypothetical protein